MRPRFHGFALLAAACLLGSGSGCGGSHAGSTASAQPAGTRAIAMLEGVPDAPKPMMRVGEMGNGRTLGANAPPITGTAKFTVNAEGVDLWLDIVGCNAASIGYTVEIHEGSTCAAENLKGPIWDAPRGGAIAPLYCVGTSGPAALYYTRLHDDKQPWRVGDKSRADVVGHILVIRDPDLGDAPLSCGVIAFDPSSTLDAGVSEAERAPIAARAAVAGICLGKMLADGGPDCPDPQKLVDCTTTHCELGSCLRDCADYVTCLEGEADVCAYKCMPTADCSHCMSIMPKCLFGFCVDALACAPPLEPGGPCSKVEACCHTQGDFEAACLDLLGKLEKVSGDATCVGLMSDWDFNTHLSVPCTYD